MAPDPNDIKVIINGKEVPAKKGETILLACKRANISIPHLCYHERLHPVGACRLCVVEVEGGRAGLAAACTTPIADGMKIHTHTPKIIAARRTNLKLLLANHDLDCPSCTKNLACKLQKYAQELLVDKSDYIGARKHDRVDESSPSIRRDNNKCILCERCVQICGDIQTVYAIGYQNRGFRTKVSPAINLNMAESPCINCGQCVVSCPTGALSEKSSINEVIAALNSGKHVIAQTAPSIRATLGECFGMCPGTSVTGKMVSALKQIGFSKVFDTNFGADVTIVEEATEFVKRFKENRDLPMITTCCPAWIKFGEQFFYKQLKHMSSCRSPQAIIASLIKTYYAEKNNIPAKDIILVDIMPCTAKKYEILRDEYKGEADYVLTTVELAKLIKLYSINFDKLPDSEFDSPMGVSTGAADIFGQSGGVMEAALRTVADLITNSDLPSFEYNKVRGMETMKEAELEIAGKKVKICVVHTTGEARKLMEQIKEGKSPYHFIEVMACYGGCIGGGGQPSPHKKEILELRAKALRDEDSGKKIRKSHQNPDVINLYKEYLGEFGGEKAHKLLHTTYMDRSIIKD
jgi:NADP-reducing hydrogenase subunit HndD